MDREGPRSRAPVQGGTVLVSENQASNGDPRGLVLQLPARFTDWLVSVDACLALTTYQAGRLMFVGRRT